MQKKLLLIFFLIISTSIFSQQSDDSYYDYEDDEDFTEFNDYDYQDSFVDTLTYENKTTEYYKERHLEKAPKNKYTEKDFDYVDDLKKKKEKKIEEKEKSGSLAGDAFVDFMANIFPYVLGILVVFIIFKSFVNTEAGFWKFGKTSKKVHEQLIHEEHEDFDKNNYEQLLHLALENKDFRLATRYYYLSLLKRLSQKKLISYHKDKTNTEYTFELPDGSMRKDFSLLAYIYDYVWYGEFQVDEDKFKTIETNYKSFLQTIS